MPYSRQDLARILRRTDSRCALCCGALRLDDYGKAGPDGWEVDHSRPRSRGGKDHGNNLYAAHRGCNRSKGARTSREARADNGLIRPPRSHRQRLRRGAVGGTAGAAAAAILVPPQIRIPWMVGSALVGALAGYSDDPTEE